MDAAKKDALRLSRKGAMAKDAPEKDIQTSLRLPHELYEQLSQAAGDRGIGEEIRQRCQASFAHELSDDPETAELATAVAKLASAASSYYRPWHEDPHTFAIVKEAIDLLLACYRPKGDPVPAPKGDPVPAPNAGNLADVLWGPEHSPKLVARTLVASEIRYLRERR
jgi:hypothetical protein